MDSTSILHRIVQTFFITLVTISGSSLLYAEKYIENCQREKEHSKWNFCLESTGFYYTLENGGTWNLSLTEGEGLQEREVFLRSLQANNCPVTLSTDPGNCENNCCYCDLEFPLPRHPITNGVVFPFGLTCEAYLQKREQQHHPDHSWQSRINQHRFSGLGQDHVSRLPFLRLYLDNLKQLEDTYNNPRLLNSKDEYKEQLRRHQDQFRLSWRNSSVLTIKNNTAAAKVLGNQETDQYGGNTTDTFSSTTPTPEPETTTMPMEEVNEIKFGFYTDTEKQVDYVTVESIPDSNLTLAFSAPTECLSRHRKWAMYPPCKFSINSTGLSTCSDVRLALNVSSILVHRYVSDVNVTVNMGIEGYSDEYSEEWNESVYLHETENSMLQCASIPTHLQITEIWAYGEHVSTLLRFWSAFYFGDCLYRNCWRDLWNVLPDEFVENLQALFHHTQEKHTPQSTLDTASFRWGYFLPLCILCLVLIVYSCTVDFYDSEFGG